MNSVKNARRFTDTIASLRWFDLRRERLHDGKEQRSVAGMKASDALETRPHALPAILGAVVLLGIALIPFVMPLGTVENPGPEFYMKERERMVARDVAARGVTNALVLQAMGRVPREEFVLPQYRRFAYQDGALPIDAQQTISQPYMVAAMTEALDPQPEDVVLEVGTGSGYQAAILAGVVRHVYSVEIIESLARSAETTLTRMGYTNITLRTGDGYQGWPDHAPYDAIIVTAAPEHVPQPLVDQLKPGGKMVIPVGERWHTQVLKVLEKVADGSMRTNELMDVRFVPMTGDPTEIAVGD